MSTIIRCDGSEERFCTNGSCDLEIDGKEL
jgi:hypothetical protein